MTPELLDRAALDPVRVDGAGERTFRAALLNQVLAACVSDRPVLRVMGLRAMILCSRMLPGCLPKLTAGLRQEMRAAEMGAHASMRINAADIELDEMQRVVDLILHDPRQKPEDIGRRVTLLAYAFCRESAVRAALPSFEVIGRDIWGLRARNPRSAVCAAMQAVVTSMVRRGQLKENAARELTEMWFAKRAATRAKYHTAQQGNGNRRQSIQAVASSHDDHAAQLADDPDQQHRANELKQEHAERIDGVPRQAMRPQFRGMTPAQIRAHLSALHEASELRRLGIY